MQNRGYEDVGAGYERVEVVVQGERVNALDDGLNFFLGRLASEKSGDLLALGGEGGFCDVLVSE